MAVGIIYVLTNDVMPGIIKIGQTTNLEQRMRSLDTTGVPMPFRCHFAIEVDGYEAKERLLHDTFSDHRCRANREFFKLAPERAMSALKLCGGREIMLNNVMIGETGEIQENERTERIEREIRGKFKFSMADVPMGAELTFTRDDSKKCIVVSDQQVEYEGNRYSLTGLAKILLKELGYNWAAVQGTAFFKYDDEILTDRRDRLESESAECEIE